MQNAEKLLIAPKQFRFYLILKHSLNLIHGVCFCLYFLDNLINGRFPFTLAWFRCSFLFLIFILSSGESILYVLLIPQLITLNQKSRRDFINSLKQLLRQKLNTYLNGTQYIINLFYIFGFGLLIWDTFISSNEETQTIINSIRYSILVCLLKHIFIKQILDKNLQKSIQEEEQNQFIFSYQLNENSKILQEQCPICYDSFKSKDHIAQYLCAGKHEFHKECLIKWLQMPYNKRKTCPYCKQEPQNKTKAFL